jgi:hypothetical protein
MSGATTRLGDIVMTATGAGGPQRNDFRGSQPGDDGMVFELAPNEITALSAQLILPDGTTHDCSLEPFHPKLTLLQPTATP